MSSYLFGPFLSLRRSREPARVTGGTHPLFDRAPKREFQHRLRHLVSAHLEELADEALDAEPGMPDGAVGH